MSASSGGSLQPTFTGHVANTPDALRLFEACLTGQLHHVPRRPHDRERNQLIRSGCVFIYEENASGIKRWTDGVPWSPSRILGNFLVYRELLKPFPPGEKKRATKRNKRPTKPGEPYPRNDSIASNGSNALSPTTPSTPSFSQEGAGGPAGGPAPGGGGGAGAAGGAGGAGGSASLSDRDKERSLIGSLVDSYGFKEDGLVKKTMSVTVQGVHHHLVSYYKVKDVINHVLRTPSEDPMLRSLRPRPELTSRQNFRAPVDEVDDGLEGQMDGPRPGYPYGDRNGYDGRPPMLGSQMYQPQLPAANNGYYHGMDVVPYSTGHQPPANPGFAAAPMQQAPYYPAQPVAPQPHVKQEDYYAQNPSYPARYEPMSSNIAPVGFAPDRGAMNPLQPMAYGQQPPVRTRPGEESQTASDSKSGESYTRGYYAPGRPGPEGVQYTGVDPRWTPTTSGAARAEGMTTSAAAYPGDKHYWPQNMAVGQGHYPAGPPLTQWNNGNVG